MRAWRVVAESADNASWRIFRCPCTGIATTMQAVTTAASSGLSTACPEARRRILALFSLGSWYAVGLDWVCAHPDLRNGPRRRAWGCWRASVSLALPAPSYRRASCWTVTARALPKRRCCLWWWTVRWYSHWRLAWGLAVGRVLIGVVVALALWPAIGGHVNGGFAPPMRTKRPRVPEGQPARSTPPDVPSLDSRWISKCPAIPGTVPSRDTGGIQDRRIRAPPPD